MDDYFDNLRTIANRLGAIGAASPEQIMDVALQVEQAIDHLPQTHPDINHVLALAVDVLQALYRPDGPTPRQAALPLAGAMRACAERLKFNRCNLRLHRSARALRALLGSAPDWAPAPSRPAPDLAGLRDVAVRIASLEAEDLEEWSAVRDQLEEMARTVDPAEGGRGHLVAASEVVSTLLRHELNDTQPILAAIRREVAAALAAPSGHDLAVRAALLVANLPPGKQQYSTQLAAS